MEDTVYKIETKDKKELKLMLDAPKLAGALYDLTDWYRAIYNGKNYGEYQILYKGQLYSEQEFSKVEKDPEDLDEYGILKSGACQYVYLESDIEHKLDELLYDVRTIIDDYFEE